MKKMLSALLSVLTVAMMSVTAFAADAAAAAAVTQQRLIGGVCVVVIFAVLGYKEMNKRKNGTDKGKTISTANAIAEQEQKEAAAPAEVEEKKED